MQNEKSSTESTEQQQPTAPTENGGTDQPASAEHNPFDKHHKDLTKEEEDNLEQFKEAQTERD